MSLLPQSATFEEMVQDCFLAFRGQGLMLSPLDVELLSTWAGHQVPVEVVARGIRRAAESALWDARPGEPALRSLRACRKQVEAEIKKYLDRAVGTGGAAPAKAEPLEVSRHKKLRAALRKVATASPAWSGAITGMLGGWLADPPQDLAEAARREEAVCLALARAMPFAQRQAMGKQLRELMGDSQGRTARARKLARRFHRGALVRRALDLPAFW